MKNTIKKEDADTLSLNQVLSILGLIAEDGEFQYQKHIFKLESINVLFTGAAPNVWEWLYATGRIV